MQKATAKASALDFRDKVLESDYEAQNNVAPFLENKVLRRIIKTFTNDPKGDFAKWARNPRVIEMLTRAKEVSSNHAVISTVIPATKSYSPYSPYSPYRP